MGIEQCARRLGTLVMVTPVTAGYYRSPRTECWSVVLGLTGSCRGAVKREREGLGAITSHSPYQPNYKLKEEWDGGPRVSF